MLRGWKEMADRKTLPRRSARRSAARGLACLARFTAVVIAAGMGFLGGPRFAASSERPTLAIIAVARDPSGQIAAARAGAILPPVIAQRDTFRLVDPTQALSESPNTTEAQNLDRAEAAAQDGRAAYDAFRLDDAIARLGQAAALFPQAGAMLGDTTRLQAVLATLGAALTLRGSADEGESIFLELLAINASYTLNDAPPPVAAVFERALKRFDHASRGQVEIYSSPSYAAVYVDGRFEGITPMTMRNVAQGTHYLRLEKTGYAPYAAAVELTPDRTVTHQARLHSIPGGAELRNLAADGADELIRASANRESLDGTNDMGNGPRAFANEAAGQGPLRSKSVQALGQLIGTDFLLFFTVTQSGRDATFTAVLIDVRASRKVASAHRVLNVDAPAFDSTLRTFTLELLDNRATSYSAATGSATTDIGRSHRADSTPDGTATGATGQGLAGNAGIADHDASTRSETYLGWVLIGAGGAALATGTVFGVLALSAQSDFKNTPQTSPDLKDIRSTGKTDALVADLCLAGGLLSAAGGVALLLLTERERTDSDDVDAFFATSSAGVAPLPGGIAVSLGGRF